MLLSYFDTPVRNTDKTADTDTCTCDVLFCLIQFVVYVLWVVTKVLVGVMYSFLIARLFCISCINGTF